MLECMKAKDCIPHATLWHYTHPSWFEDLGGFERRENAAYFIEYARVLFLRFRRHVQLWTTFNEPIVALLGGYGMGIVPPGKPLRIARIGQVYANMLEAHDLCYRELKALPGGATARVGFVHNYATFVPLKDGLLYLGARVFSRFATNMWANQGLIDFFRTGVFEWHSGIPGTGTRRDLGRRPGLDFIGVNFYSRGVLGMFLQPACFPGEEMTEMPYAMWPRGMYECLKHLADAGVPLLVSENGISDSKDAVRGAWIDGYLAEVERAIEDGIDVRGYLYWTLTDNFEWQFGFNMRFGLFEWVPETGERVLREGSKRLLPWFAKLRRVRVGRKYGGGARG